MNQSPTIVVLSGPTGGHLFPAFAFAEAYLDRQPEGSLILVTGQRAVSFLHRENASCFKQIIFLRDFPFPRGFSLRLLPFLLQLLVTFCRYFDLVNKTRPDLMVGFGSYISFPGVVVASWKRIPTIIHEQNVIPGKATKWMEPFVRMMALTFQDSEPYVSQKVQRVVTGLPVRRSLVKKAENKGPKSTAGSLTILVMGGSQGSLAINRTVIAAFQRLSSEEISQIVVIHITGDADFKWVSAQYQGMKMKHEVLAYTNQIADFFERADIAITRGGASTLNELALFKLPAIVVPYPHAEAHQSENVEVFRRLGGVIACYEKNLNANWLSGQISELFANRDRLAKMSQAMGARGPWQAAERLASLADQLLGDL